MKPYKERVKGKMIISRVLINDVPFFLLQIKHFLSTFYIYMFANSHIGHLIILVLSSLWNSLSL